MTRETGAYTRAFRRRERYLRLAFRLHPTLTVVTTVAWVFTLAVVFVVTWPLLSDSSRFGAQDWDFATAARYLVKLSLRRYHELPFWNPFACGGLPAWGYVEGGTNLVSPWLLPYLGLPISTALRVEVVGMGLLGSVGAFVLAGRFTRSPSSRLLVVALWAVDTRWALQTNAGHTWHFAYAWMPWCFYFFDRALAGAHRGKATVALAASLAMIAYAGGIYPLPHTLLALGVYAGALAGARRSLRPVGTLAISVGLSLGLAAPKLLPMLVTFAKAPRLVASDESMSLRALYDVFTMTTADRRTSPFPLAYGWHEYGIYVSTAGLVALFLGVLFVRGSREVAITTTGCLFVIIGLGAFASAAPWTLLHAYVPSFRSQHVPSRFLYPALLLLSVGAGAGVGRAIGGRVWLEAVSAMAVIAIGLRVGVVAQDTMRKAMVLVAPKVVEHDDFHFEQRASVAYVNARGGSAYLSMTANRGVVECYGYPEFGPVGARSETDPAYRGEAYVEDGGGGRSEGSAHVVEWSPNRAVIAVDGAATGGSILVYNMNFDEGWHSDAGAVVRHEDKVAVALDGARSRVIFTYRPPGLAFGLVLGAVAAGVSGWLVLDRRRRGSVARFWASRSRAVGKRLA